MRNSLLGNLRFWVTESPIPYEASHRNETAQITVIAAQDSSQQSLGETPGRTHSLLRPPVFETDQLGPSVSADTRKSDSNTSSNHARIQQQLAVIVAELLGLDKVESEDNFFMLGGHSLLGTQLIIRVRESFGVDISLRTVFTHPTVAGISAEIDRLLEH